MITLSINARNRSGEQQTGRKGSQNYGLLAPSAASYSQSAEIVGGTGLCGLSRGCKMVEFHCKILPS
jgi:hypothetical protein